MDRGHLNSFQFLTQFKHEVTRFPCLKGCCDLRHDACGPSSFLEYRHLVLIWFLQVPMKPALVFDKILQSLNWQRQDSLTRSQVARTLSWELVPSRPVGPASKECFICKSSYLGWL